MNQPHSVLQVSHVIVRNPPPHLKVVSVHLTPLKVCPRKSVRIAGTKLNFIFHALMALYSYWYYFTITVIHLH